MILVNTSGGFAQDNRHIRSRQDLMITLEAVSPWWDTSLAQLDVDIMKRVWERRKTYTFSGWCCWHSRDVCWQGHWYCRKEQPLLKYWTVCGVFNHGLNWLFSELKHWHRLNLLYEVLLCRRQKVHYSLRSSCRSPATQQNLTKVASSACCSP